MPAPDAPQSTDLIARLHELEIRERDVASSMDMRAEDTANWEYAETAKAAATEIKQLRQDATIRDVNLLAFQQIEHERDGLIAELEGKQQMIERLRAALKDIYDWYMADNEDRGGHALEVTSFVLGLSTVDRPAIDVGDKRG